MDWAKFSDSVIRNVRRPLHLLKSTFLNLPDSLARDEKLGSEFIKRERAVGKPARFQDLPFAAVERHQRLV